MPTRSEPAPAPSEVFAEELARTRERKGVTQQQLADRLLELGLRIDRSAVGKIETCARSVTIDELFGIAAALSVSPLTLVIPRSKSEIQVTPEVRLPASEVQQWARGSQFLFIWEDSEVADLRYFFEDSMTDEESAMFRRYRNLRTIVDIVGALRGARSNLQYQRLLINLAVWTQREWLDLGNTGWAGEPANPKVMKKAVEEMAKVIYSQLSEQEKD